MPSLTVLLLVHGKVTSRVVSRYKMIWFIGSSVVDPKLFFFSDPDPTFQEISDPDPDSDLDPT